MASEGFFSISVASVLEDVLKEQGSRLSDMDLASRKAEEAAARRYEAAGWLRRTVGVVCAKDLPEAPSEEEFRIGLRSGLILCSALNKVVSLGDSVVIPDGAALSAYQYFENVRNFLVAIEEIGIPSFEASDLEQGGKSSRIVNCVLELKSYSEWKQMGGYGSWKFSGNVKPTISGKAFIRKHLDPFSNCLARPQSVNDSDSNCAFQNLNGVDSKETTSRYLNVLVQMILSDKRPDEIPVLVESMLSKVMLEFERRIASQNELVKTALKGLQDDGKSFLKLKVLADTPFTSCDMKKDAEVMKCTYPNKNFRNNSKKEDASKKQFLKQYSILDQQERDIQVLRLDLQTARSGIEFMQRKYLEELHIIGRHMHSLANAASGYHKVLAENRKLYNQVQDLKGSIRVYCRVRPFLPGQLSNSIVGCIDDGNITIITPAKYGKEGHKSFTFNKVFGPSASQEHVFSDTQSLIRSVLDGYNVCIFAYGQTGSGKTYTMSGPKEVNQHNMGVNYRALSDLFNLAQKRGDAFTYDISVQMIEIYNEQNGVNVPSANLIPVSSTPDVIELMNIGQRNRAIGSTALNDRSSRSHSCLTVHVQGKDLTSGVVLRGCMHLVDLAGSERVNKSEVTGERLKEAQHINKSLSALGDVISALAQKSSHVPYRNSKLTQLLQDSLGGQAKTLMFVHINPEIDAVGETISTLKFAERVSTVELGAARLNKEAGDVKELKEQIAILKSTLARREGESEHLQTGILNFDASNMKTRLPCAAYVNRQQGGNPFNHQSSTNILAIEEVRGNSTTRQKKQSFDFPELLITEDSLPWPDASPGANSQKGDDGEVISGDWVDKIMVNKHENPLNCWVGSGETLPDFFYQRYVSDNRANQDQSYCRNGHQKNDSNAYEIQRHGFDPATTDDSDHDLDVATSDSSEADALWQFNIPKAACINNSAGSKFKRSQIKSLHNPDLRTRTPTRAHIPSPSKKTSNGTSRASRQPSSMDVKSTYSSSGGRMSSGNRPHFNSTSQRAFRRFKSSPSARAALAVVTESWNRPLEFGQPVPAHVPPPYGKGCLLPGIRSGENGVGFRRRTDFCKMSDPQPRLQSLRPPPVALATLIGRELRGGKSEKPTVRYGHAGLAKRGEDYLLIKPDCCRVPGNAATSFSVFAIFDGHNGVSAAVFAKEHLLDHVMSAIPPGIGREEWLQALPRAFVAGFVKTDIEFQRKGEASGTTATLVIIDGLTVTVASVGDSRCILDSEGGAVSLLTVDHRLEENEEERERVTASGGEVGRLNLCGGQEVGPLRCWPGGLCLSRSIGDTDVGEFIVPIPYVKQLLHSGGRLVIASDGIWDALSSEMAAKSCRGLPVELAAKMIVKEALRTSGLRDDTTCLVVDVIPPDHSIVVASPRKNGNKFTSLFNGLPLSSLLKLTHRHSTVGAIEELFEEGSAVLEESSSVRPLLEEARFVALSARILALTSATLLLSKKESLLMDAKTKP
ncbi:Kinesin-4 [Apostasia shenzhenica]|uniref:protein-serine/threonine phosphatase n=1 Tax=Apostasia shenzhenica TaxID=1088818 RepID=A0A2I0AS76_9ASPA|nr:Kinesin-4 [Apostasia shenzhenica]